MKGWTQVGTYVVPYKGEEYEVEVEGLFYETKEGQDADGNRGQWMTYCDDISITNITPAPPDEAARHYIEEHINGLNADDFTWKVIDDEDEIWEDGEGDEDFGGVTAKII